MKILLDVGTLALISNPKASSDSTECYQWIESMILKGSPIFVPEIADYEIRRELIRADKFPGLARLDIIKNTLGYLRITTSVMLAAAAIWAQARRTGDLTTGDTAFDRDVILSAQAVVAGAIVVSDKVGHLSRFIQVKNWRDLK
jgi:predicted nucleic acid-binding protein